MSFLKKPCEWEVKAEFTQTDCGFVRIIVTGDCASRVKMWEGFSKSGLEAREAVKKRFPNAKLPLAVTVPMAV